jgi:hypothetical protein
MGMQGIPDWVEMMRKAAKVLELSSQYDGFSMQSGSQPQATLTSAQLKSRDLYIFCEQSQRKSSSSQIYTNIGLACLAIRRLLQVTFFLSPSQPTSDSDGRVV